MQKEEIIKAYLKIREIDNTIPDEVLDFMKNSALEKLDDESYNGDCYNVRKDSDIYLKCSRWHFQNTGCYNCFKEFKPIN